MKTLITKYKNGDRVLIDVIRDTGSIELVNEYDVPCLVKDAYDCNVWIEYDLVEVSNGKAQENIPEQNIRLDLKFIREEKLKELL